MLSSKRKDLTLLLIIIFAVSCMTVPFLSEAGDLKGPYQDANKYAKEIFTEAATYCIKTEVRGYEIPDMAVCGNLKHLPVGEPEYDGSPEDVEKGMIYFNSEFFVNNAYYYLKIKDNAPQCVYFSSSPILLEFKEKFTCALEKSYSAYESYMDREVFGSYPNEITKDNSRKDIYFSSAAPVTPIYDFTGVRTPVIRTFGYYLRRVFGDVIYEPHYLLLVIEAAAIALYIALYPFFCYGTDTLEHNAEMVSIAVAEYIRRGGYLPDGVYCGSLFKVMLSKNPPSDMCQYLSDKLGNGEKNYYVYEIKNGRIKVWFSGRRFSRKFRRYPAGEGFGIGCAEKSMLEIEEE